MKSARIAILAALGIILGFAGVVWKKFGQGPAETAVDGPAAVGKESAAAKTPSPATTPIVKPVVRDKSLGPESKIAVGQHILVSFKGSEVGFGDRSQEEAKRLAIEIAERLERGEEVATLVERFSDDPARSVDLGIRRVANWGKMPDSDSITPRDALPAAYTDLLFSLERGKCGVAEYDRQKNSLGYFVVKRIE